MALLIVQFVWFFGAFMIWKKDTIYNFVLKMGNFILAMWVAYEILMKVVH